MVAFQCIIAIMGGRDVSKALKNYKIVNVVNIFWRFVAVSNGSKTPLFDFFSAFEVSRTYHAKLFREI